ncbi:hypothetical protein KQX54_012798 [Cotesia glomerata]|uniref:Uncharacterized protein n=1 Tax=Cotesia glomerata TaxID=32391 RepID=A0AAV7HE69_COTGL|nr:hypothetical protein KQX54_012798 [Cotesia glomerata]
MQYNTKKTTSSLRYDIKNKHPEKCQATTLINEIDSDSQSEAENGLSTQENSNKRPRLSIPRKEYYSLNDTDNPCCREYSAKIVGKTVSYPQCSTKYHPSCAFLTGTNSSGVFTRCCSHRPASPLPFLIEALKESIIEELNSSLQDIIVTSVNKAIGPLIQSTMQPQISSLKRNLEDTVNKHLGAFNKKVDAKLNKVHNSIAATTSVLIQRVDDIES